MSLNLQLNAGTPKVAKLSVLATAASMLGSLSGCSFFHHTEVKAAVIPTANVTAAPLDLAKVQPNEAGTVPVLMFHNIKGDKINEAKLEYPAAMFRQDLQWLYDHKYRPVSLTQFVQGRIDCPAGMSPVILTFDDALPSQFKFDSDGKIDPDCAVGILEAFHSAHSDWQLRGTFFVLTDENPKFPPPFYQAEYAQGKMEHLVQDGFDIGNHTVTHGHMRRMTDAQVVAEFAGAVAGIHKYLPDYNVQTIAMPFGEFPKNRKLLISGSSGGISYHNICAMAAAWRPIPSPVSPKFTPYYLERISTGTKMHESRWWFDYLEKHPDQKYVSDGDPNTITINAMNIGQINKAKVQALHLRLRTYNGTQLVASSN